MSTKKEKARRFSSYELDEVTHDKLLDLAARYRLARNRVIEIAVETLDEGKLPLVPEGWRKRGRPPLKREVRKTG